jgi:nucleotide sugar dehydrogenase
MTPAIAALESSSPLIQEECSSQGPSDCVVIDLRKTPPDFATGRPIVAVVGLGYVGLPTALSIASATFGVVGIDVSRRRIELIREGRVGLLPADHPRLVEALESFCLRLTDDPSALREATAVLICVPTPVDDHLVPDLSYLKSACATVVEHARSGQTIILTSTTCVGTTRELLVDPLIARGFTPGKDVFVAFSPERIDPGNADRAQGSIARVVGGATPRCTLRTLAVLGQMTREVHTVRSLEAAEFTKLYENTFRAVNIAFANEMAEMSRELGLDVIEIIDAASTKPYGFMPFYPGPGAGGHCIPCDPHYLLWQMRAQRHQSRLIEEAMSGLAARPGRVVQRAIEILAERGGGILGAKILVVGVSYKPGVEDVRGSPAVEVIQTLRSRGADVQYHDPLVPSLLLRDGTLLRSVAKPEAGGLSLAIVHVLHPGSDAGWLERCPSVLDATYRLNAVPHREVL